VKAAQLLHVADVVGVEQHRGLARPRARGMVAFAARVLERQRPAQVLLGLDPTLQHLQVVGAQQGAWLAQDRDHLRSRSDRRDSIRGRGRGEVKDRGLAQQLPGLCRGEQRQVLLERLRRVPVFAVGDEVIRLLVRGHENFGMLAQRFVQRRRSALGLADDEEVGDSDRALLAGFQAFSLRVER
jgi:hypothetical protein